MSSAQSQTAPSQQQQKEVRKPPFADWPTIKILTPPQGQFSLQKDEWCVTYCSQSVTGRFHGREPYCQSLCVRKVFPHEVKNILTFKKHKALGSNGKATYPLPAEGQTSNLPRMLGGRPSEDSEDSDYKRRPRELPKSWDEGWYFWTGRGRLAAHEKMDSMSMDFERQRQMAAMRAKRKEVWQDYENSIRRQKSNGAPMQDRIWVPNVPPRPSPDTSSSKSILVTLPPDFPSLFERINKLLAPTVKVLNITYHSFKSGEQKAFAHRVWDKAWTNEPFQLANKCLAHAYERWKEKEEAADEEDDKKNS